MNYFLKKHKIIFLHVYGDSKTFSTNEKTLQSMSIITRAAIFTIVPLEQYGCHQT